MFKNIFYVVGCLYIVSDSFSSNWFPFEVTKELSSNCRVTCFTAYNRFVKENRLRLYRFVQGSARSTWKSVTIVGGSGTLPRTHWPGCPDRSLIRLAWFPVEKWGKHKWLGSAHGQEGKSNANWNVRKFNKDSTSSMNCGQCYWGFCKKPFHTYQCSCSCWMRELKDAKRRRSMKGNGRKLQNANCDSYGAIMMERC